VNGGECLLHIDTPAFSYEFDSTASTLTRSCIVYRRIHTQLTSSTAATLLFHRARIALPCALPRA
jgi:hypothetical protein